MKQILILLLISAANIFASIGEITAVHGKAELHRGSETKQIVTGTKLEKHDIIHTGKNSKLQIVFNDKTVISLGQKSDFRVDEYIFEAKKVEAKFSVTKGFFKSITGKIGKIAPSHFKVKTANATIGVRGTTIIGEVSPQLDIIACTYGQIVVTTPQGSVIVNQGERTVVIKDKSPRAAQKVNPVVIKKLDEQSDTSQNPTPLPAAKQTTTRTATPVVDTEPTQSEEVIQKKQTVNEEEPEDEKETSQDENNAPLPEEPGTLDNLREIVGTQRPLYKGTITEGATTYGTIKQNAQNDVSLQFDLGAGTVDGNLKFEDRLQRYDIQVGGRIRSDATFDFNSQNGYSGGGYGKLSGEKLQNANGGFDFNENDLQSDMLINHIEGKFETTRQ
jgi:hypothetical protein